jgi:cbb3-type cytochrome oxidase subunit 1
MNDELKSAIILCIIDKSGSMESIRSDAIGGFNAFISRHKKMNGQTWVTLVLFDHEYEMLSRLRPLQRQLTYPGAQQLCSMQSADQ